MSFRRSIAATALTFALALGGAAAAQVVVLSSRGPSAHQYPQGAVLGANKVLRLAAGDQIELLDGTGSHIITGPAVVTAGHVDPHVRDQVIQTFIRAQQNRPGVAATRGFQLQPLAAPDLWQLDINQAGPLCVAGDIPPSLWRSDSNSSHTVRLTRLATGETQTVAWEPGASTAVWPSGLPTVDGERYTLTQDDGSAVTFPVRMVGTPTGGFQGLADTLSDRKCYSQLERLREALLGD